MFDFIQTRKYGILLHTQNNRCEAGHVKLFNEKGPSVYFFHREVPNDKSWALKRVWYFWIFSIIHIGEGKSTSRNGWHVSWRKVYFKKECNAILLKWEKPLIWHTIPAKVKKRSILTRMNLHGHRA